MKFYFGFILVISFDSGTYVIENWGDAGTVENYGDTGKVLAYFYTFCYFLSRLPSK